jgi:pimeloyl-ACP methyl ester carboxylesterase
VTARIVLLLHGIGSSAADQWIDTGWTDLFESLGRRVIAPDLPGHGASPKFTDSGRYVDTIARLLALVRDDPGRDGAIDAVGFSAGGQLLQAMAATEPALFRRIAVIGVGHWVIAGLADGSPPSPELDHAQDVLRRLNAMPGNDAEAIRAFVQGGLPRLDPAVMSRITARTLLIIGDRDFTGEVAPYAPFIPDVTTFTVAGLDHFSATDDRRVIRSVVDFITQ